MKPEIFAREIDLSSSKVLSASLLQTYDALDSEAIENSVDALRENQNVSFENLETPFQKYRRVLYVLDDYKFRIETRPYPVFMDIEVKYFDDSSSASWSSPAEWGESGYEISEISFHDPMGNEVFKGLANFCYEFRSTDLDRIADRHVRVKKFLKTIFEFAEGQYAFYRKLREI